MDEYIKLETLLERAEYDSNYRLVIPVEVIKAAPAADVVPVVHGRWIFGGDGCVICSKCNEEESNDNHRNYCPHCGAKMDGGAK